MFIFDFFLAIVPSRHGTERTVVSSDMPRINPPEGATVLARLWLAPSLSVYMLALAYFDNTPTTVLVGRHTGCCRMPWIGIGKLSRFGPLTMMMLYFGGILVLVFCNVTGIPLKQVGPIYSRRI